MKKEKKKNSRRNFLKNMGALSLGAAAMGGGAVAGASFKTASGKTVKALTPDGQLIEVDASEIKPVKKEKLTENQKRGREGIAGKSWVMVIDLAKCRNARKCITSCQSAHSLKPEQYHINTLTLQENENTAPYYMPKPCFHCDNPPCTKVCPVNATFKRQDGIVLIDNERCIGCRFCMAACPYSARIFNWHTPINEEKDKGRTYDIELNVPQKRGTVSKCLFSADRLRINELPYCVTACPNSVFWFGDENEGVVTNGTTKETTDFGKLLEDNAAYTIMPELGTKPRVYYLPPKNRMFPYEHKEIHLEEDIPGAASHQSKEGH